MQTQFYIGTAGWSVPRASADRLGGHGTHLERYAHIFNCVEINSSFHRPHAVSTYERWAAATPSDFRFAVKVPRAITHELKLRRTRTAFDQFLLETDGLGRKRAPLLVQLPPSLAFDTRVATRFWEAVRSRYEGLAVCEPRHPTWFSARAGALLRSYRVARVAADPAPVAEANVPGGWQGVIYFRLHGTPRKYWSRYEPGYLATLASTMRRLVESVDVWCIFDNTASGAAVENAWELQRLLAVRS